MHTVKRLDTRKYIAQDPITGERFTISAGQVSSAFGGRGKSKMNNTRTVYGGYWYASGLEADYARDLDLRLKARHIKGWQRQVPIELRVHGILITTYKIDFIIEHLDGSEELIEVKGQETYEWRLRWKLLEAIYQHDFPDTKLTIIKANQFQRKR